MENLKVEKILVLWRREYGRSIDFYQVLKGIDFRRVDDRFCLGIC